MHRDKPMTVADPVDKSLTVRQRQIAGRIAEHDSVVGFQALSREFLPQVVVGAGVVCGELSSALCRQIGNQGIPRCDGAMAETFGDTDHEQTLWFANSH